MRLSVVHGTEDYKLFKEVINQGIDSHLEAFTASTFKTWERRLYCDFDPAEIPILIRRLEEIGSEEALSWVEDIKAELERERKGDS